MYRAIWKYRMNRESVLARRNASFVLSCVVIKPTRSPEQSITHERANRASLVALRIIILNITSNFAVLALYLASMIHPYCFERNPPLIYALGFLCESILSLQIVWVGLLFRAIRTIAVGRPTSLKELQQSARPSLRYHAAPSSEQAFNDARTNIIVR